MKSLFLCTLLMSFSAYAFEFKVSAIRGEAKLENAKTMLKVDDELRLEDVIVTSEKSFIKIAYANGGMITVGPNSSIKLLKQNNEKVSSLALLKGQVRAVFDKKENTDYKFFIKTRTAALGVRGTDFHFIYNPDNNVSTVLTYEGKVEFSEGDSIRGHDTIKVPKGYISGVFYHSSKASEPIKISPLQFSLLEANQDLKEGTGQKVVTPKESKSIDKDTDLSKKDENIIPAPKNFLTDEYFEDRVKGNPTIRGGGYLDLKTGIYIDPPENSEYDAEHDLYFPPVEFGGVDEESGEYVAPPGLILHPLKGFMFTTDVLQKGFHNVTSVVQSGVTPVVGAVTYVGEKSYDTLKNSAAMLRDNTGPVGTTVQKGVDLVGTGVSTTLDTAENTSSFILNTTADTLNYTVHDIFLARIKNVKEQIPFISSWRFKFNQGFNYNHINADKYNLYDRSVVRESTMESQTNLDVKYQKNFYTNFFVRPRFEMKWKNYLGSNSTLKGFDKLIFYYGSDFGYSTTNKEMKYQTYVSIEKGKTRQGQDSKDEFITHEDSWRFGLTKLILGQKTFSTTLDYHYERYSDVFDGDGHRHQFDISEIVSISDTRLIKLTVDWNKILQEKYGDTTNWGAKLNFFMTTLKWNMSYDIWGGLRFLSNTGTLVKRDSERDYFLGASLTKSFANSFSVQFSYEILKQTSPLQIYKYVSQEFATNIYYIF